MDEFLSRTNKVIKTSKGFELDLDTFENFIENFQPLESIPKILRVSVRDLDEWCMLAYNMKYSEAYVFLWEKSLFYQRRAINDLAKNGHNKALEISTTYLSKLAKQEHNTNLKVSICASVPIEDDEDDEEDEE